MIRLPPVEIVVEGMGLGELAGAPLARAIMALERGAMLGAQFAQGMWIRFAQEADVRETGAYIRGIQADGAIQVVKEPAQTGGEQITDWEIVIEITNSAPHASIVEEGHGAFHLPSVINWGAGGGRIKRSKDGRAYLHIPFKHGAHVSPEEAAEKGYTRAQIKRMMPAEIHREAKKLANIIRRHEGPIHSQGGQFIAADRYRTEGRGRSRLDRRHTRPGDVVGGVVEHRGATTVGKSPEGFALVNPAWKSSKYHGLFKSGPPGHEQYMTIRTMTQDSHGWNIPAQKGHFLAKHVAAALQNGPDLPGIVLGGMAEVLHGTEGGA